MTPIARDTTTIRIGNKTKKLLASLKLYPRETYDDAIKRLLSTNKGK